MILGGFGALLFLPANKNEYRQRIQLLRDCYIHNKAFKFKALRRKRRTQEVLAHCWAHEPDFEGSLTRVTETLLLLQTYLYI